MAPATAPMSVPSLAARRIWLLVCSANAARIAAIISARVAPTALFQMSLSVGNVYAPTTNSGFARTSPTPGDPLICPTP